LQRDDTECGAFGADRRNRERSDDEVVVTGRGGSEWNADLSDRDGTGVDPSFITGANHPFGMAVDAG
jgi:hypothetical protein